MRVRQMRVLQTVAWWLCLGAGGWTVFLLWHHRKFIAELRGGPATLLVPLTLALLLPVGLALWALRCAFRARLQGLILSTLALVAFCIVTGYSIGSSYLPAAVALVISTCLTALKHEGAA